MDRIYMRRRMADELQDVTVVDVYDQAALIGKEFEKIIDIHGVDAVTDLMPKVIRILEQLEVLANRNEKENTEINELRFSVEKLEAEKAEKAQIRVKYEQELEQIEENWHKESQDLLLMVNKLTDENRKLKTNMRAQKETELIKATDVMKKSEEEEIRVLTKLKETVDKQREQLRRTQRDLSQKSIDCQAFQAQSERIAKVNSELRRKNNSSRKQARVLLEEKADLQTQITDKEKQITQIQDMIREQDSAEHTNNSCPSSPASFKNHMPLNSPEYEEEISKIEEKLSMIGKMVIDMKDPNRPRFTLGELREVLLERNELKTKLIEVEEELEVYKPKSEDDDDFAVQGPINREPDEKLFPERFKKDESGIRKFFSFLFRDPKKFKEKPDRSRSRSQLSTSFQSHSPRYGAVEGGVLEDSMNEDQGKNTVLKEATSFSDSLP